MNVLVTGGLGLIGHNVVRRLQAQGHTVSIIDTKTNYDIIPQHDAIKSFIQRYSYLNKLADSINQDTILRLLNPMIHYEVLYDQDLVRKYNNFSPAKINIADHYCSDGNRHKFDIFVFSKILPSGVLDSKDNMEVTSKEVAKWFRTDNKEKIKKFKDYYYVDERCSHCKVYLSKIKKDDTIVDKMKTLDNYKAFYDYFENRCPEGNLHDYKIDAQKDVENCTKCNFTRKLFDELNKPYYEKYIKKYKKIYHLYYLVYLQYTIFIRKINCIFKNYSCIIKNL